MNFADSTTSFPPGRHMAPEAAVRVCTRLFEKYITSKNSLYLAFLAMSSTLFKGRNVTLAGGGVGVKSAAGWKRAGARKVSDVSW